MKLPLVSTEVYMKTIAGLIIIVVIASVLIFSGCIEESVEGFDRIGEFNPLWVSVFVTIVLVIITGYYAMETRKIRLESARPIFSLKTGSYTIRTHRGYGVYTHKRFDYISEEGEMHKLYLRNTGGVARDVDVDIETSTNENKSFFVPSLDSGQEIDLRVNFQQIKESNGFVKVKMKFKDGYNRNLIDELSVDLKQLSGGDREITFQVSPKDRYIEVIAQTLEGIERELHNRK
jgi:hypothetical protein